MKRRIDWVDSAKGVAILGTIVSHSVEQGTLLRNFLFSFHMPLFFILSGFTANPVNDKKSLLAKTKKDLIKLICPVFIIAAARYAYYFLFLTDHSAYSAYILLKKLIVSLYWSTSVQSFDAVGALWFLICLFMAKLIFNLHNIYFKNDKNKGLCFILGILGIILGYLGKRLPFNFDITLVAVLFITIGYTTRTYFNKIKNKSLVYLLLAIIIWEACLLNGQFIELKTRNYGANLLTTIEAVCGTFVVCYICNVVNEKKIIKKVLNFLGINSLIILCIHSIDWMYIDLWNYDNEKLKIIIRVILVLLLSGVIILLKSSMSILKKRKNKGIYLLVSSYLLNYK